MTQAPRPHRSKTVPAWRKGEERTVAFVDILGFAHEVAGLDKDPARFPEVVDALVGGFSPGALPLLFEYPRKALLGGHGAVDIQRTFFSDCAYVSARRAEDAPDAVVTVVLDYCKRLLLRGYFLRGGLARGRVAHRGAIIVGPAAVLAYDLERKAAGVPRIVVQDEVALDLLELADKPNQTATIRHGDDGLYYLDVLTTLGLGASGPRLLAQATSVITSHLNRGGPAEILSKWRWAAAQLNRAVRCAREVHQGLPVEIERNDVPTLPD